MSILTPSKSSGKSSYGVFAITKAKILLALSVLLVWSIAFILPSYKHQLKTAAKNKYHDALHHIPAIKVDWRPNYDPKAQYNSSKVALIIEGRPLPHLVSQLTHMISVVPPDWRFLFIGSNKSVTSVSRSFAIQYHEANGKLDFVVLPKPWSVESKEDVYQLLTDVRFYDIYLPRVEWLLKFESDAIMCANSNESLNDWLGYDWAGAPRFNDDTFAGNGGLSLRRISKVRRILNFQARYNGTEPEDDWFGRRIAVLPGAKVATPSEGNYFSVEEVWHERPMGFHVRQGGEKLPNDVWKNQERRKKNFEYCPELTMIMPMKFEKERCEDDIEREETAAI